MATSAAPRPKLRLKAALAEIQPAQIALQRDLAVVRAWAGRHRGTLAAAGAFLGGLALIMLPRRVWRGIGGAAAGIGAAMLRSFLTPMIAGALVARRHGGAPTVDKPEPGAVPRGDG